MTQATYIVIGGSIGAGKTTLAYALKNLWKAHFNQKALVLETDTQRRIHLGYDLKYRMRSPDYSTEVDKEVFKIIDDTVEKAMQDNLCVIQCLTGDKEDRYIELKEEAKKYNAQFYGLFLAVSEDNIMSRIQKRLNERHELDELSVEHGHASDADHTVLLKFPIPAFIPEGYFSIDADKSKEDVLTEAARFLGIV